LKSWRSNLAIKIAAVCLFGVLLVAAGLSLLGVILWYDSGMYHADYDPVAYSGFASSAAYRFARETLTDYLGGTPLEELTAYAESDTCNYRFALYRRVGDGEETLLGGTLGGAPARAGHREVAVYDEGGARELLPSVDPPYSDGFDVVYRIESNVKETLPNRADPLYSCMSMLRWLEGRRDTLITVLINAVVLGIADFVVLCCMVGHRKGREEIVLNFADRLPLELYALVLGGAAVVLIALAVCFAFEQIDLFLNALGLAAIWGAGMLALAFALSFVTRVKAGGWWRNTILWRVLKLCRRLFGGTWGLVRRIGQTVLRAVRAVPLAWRACLITAGLLLALFLLGLESSYEGFCVFLYFLLSLVILGTVALAVLQLRQLQRGGAALAGGRFETKLDTKHLFWDFRRHAENLNAIGDGMAHAVEERMRSERLKTELITNVSHDIKTPLTSIINYVDLLQKAHTREEETKYLEVLARHTARLKKLTEDLVEASKASTGNLSVTLAPVNLSEALDQALGEYRERLAAGQLELVVSYAPRETMVRADGRLFWRVLDNLLSNVCKYALPGTRVYVASEAADSGAAVSIKNISREPLNVSAEELMERFVRGDASRSTEGSGLGLNIARSLIELQGGTLRLTVDGDLFKAEITLVKA